VRPRAGLRRYLTWLWGMGLALLLLGCQPWIYEAPAPPPPPPPQQALPPPPSRPVFYVNASRLNLRACPGMDCPKISVLELNEAVERLGEAEDWSQVRVKRDGRLGWVASRYLSAAPVAPPPEALPAPPAAVGQPVAPEVPPPVIPPPERPSVVKPPVAEKPKPAKPPEAAPPPPKKKVEEGRPAKPAKPAEAAEPAPRKPATPPAAKPAPPEKPEAPAPEPTPPAEPAKRIRIM
jgi:hypothetical protein